jgi:hypothetical protein
MDFRPGSRRQQSRPMSLGPWEQVDVIYKDEIVPVGWFLSLKRARDLRFN